MKVFHIDGIEVLNSIYEYLDSNMYLLFPCEGKAIIVDPHKSVECSDLLRERGVNDVIIILTHEHSDHTSGIYWYQEQFDCKLICQKFCATHISKERAMRPILISFILEEQDREKGTHQLQKFKEDYSIHTYTADITFDESYDYRIGELRIHLEHIPGHSNGSSLIIINNAFAFTGDSLMRENPVITRFPGSNHNLYLEKTLPKLANLDSQMVIFPGHGVPFEMKDMIVNGTLHIDYK